jgi:hypothetical protein
VALNMFNAQDRSTKRERVIIYGDPGIGKSRLMLSLTERFGNILYYAADDNSEFLDSISEEKRQRIFVIKPVGDDAIVNFQEFCEHDWRAEEGTVLPDGRIFPRIDTIVVDTYTAVVERTLQATANQGLAGAEKHFYVETADGGKITIPNRGDYRGNDSLSSGFLDTLFDKQRDFHIIFGCHEQLKYVEEVCVGGGPSHPGRRMLKELPGRFNTVIRLIRDTVEVQHPEYHLENVVIAVTENDGQFVAKVRTSDEDQPNPLARVILERNPINFWRAYDAIYAPEASQNTEAVNG